MLNPQFDNCGGGGGDEEDHHQVDLVGETSPEYELYKEAKAYDQRVQKGHVFQTLAPAPVISSTEPVRSSRVGALLGPNEDVVPDNISEAGTYTIDHRDTDEARESIDKAFGVGDADDEEDELDKDFDPQEAHNRSMSQMEMERSRGRPTNSMDAEVGSAASYAMDNVSIYIYTAASLERASLHRGFG